MSGKWMRSLKGYVQIQIDSPMPERFLNLCAFHHISLWGLLCKNDEYVCFLSVQDYQRLDVILSKTRTKVHVLGCFGLPFFFQKYRARKAFLAALFCACIFLYALTLFVWKIEISGLNEHSEEEVLACLKEERVRYGMLKHHVDCDAIERALRSAFPDIVWAGATLDGTYLFVQIKENVESYEKAEEDSSPADLISQKDGEVLSIVTRNGTPVVEIGDHVTKGQVLISGRQERRDDAGTVVGYEDHRADGDVRIRTSIPYEDHIAYRHREKQYTGKKRYRVSLSFFDQKLTVWKGKPKFEEYDTEKKKLPVVIGRAFYLPLELELTSYREYLWKDAVYTKEEATAAANRKFREYVEHLEKKGLEIIQNSVTIQLGETKCVTSGMLVVSEPAATAAPLKPMDTPVPLDVLFPRETPDPEIPPDGQ